jgi:hypothetical protein
MVHPATTDPSIGTMADPDRATAAVVTFRLTVVSQ